MKLESSVTNEGFSTEYVLPRIDLESLRHHYIVMRHAESTPNVKNIMLSDPIEGCKAENGLTENGRRQALENASSLANYIKEKLPKNYKIAVIHSGFSRTKETAIIVQKELYKRFPRSSFLGDLDVSPLLRERKNGPHYEGKCAELCESEVYPYDNLAKYKSLNGYEPTWSVYLRFYRLVIHLENDISQRTIFILLTHADNARNAQCGVNGLPVQQHNKMLPFVRYAEWRDLHVAPEVKSKI